MNNSYHSLKHNLPHYYKANFDTLPTDDKLPFWKKSNWKASHDNVLLCAMLYFHFKYNDIH